ncbi:hypothetical protein [Bathymodiolus japonicus methanotrophic gill symbiont]|uniref:hypothetical protein n=1 Tax=Bathymodiolus japonicus methanotrophic gill symbiont TaxID=113269 RepID=UPI001C8E3FA3|nr:hypothetical protein [Bathymodiolus japonicus methanotrophic gill symbiont]
MATTNGSTAIRDKILASLARYRALRIGKFPCAFWRLSALPGLTAREDIKKCRLGRGTKTSNKNAWITLVQHLVVLKERVVCMLWVEY